MERQRRYPSELADAQWEIVEPMLPLIKSPGRIPKRPPGDRGRDSVRGPLRDPAVSEAFIRSAAIDTMIRRIDRGRLAKRQTRCLLNPPQ